MLRITKVCIQKLLILVKLKMREKVPFVVMVSYCTWGVGTSRTGELLEKSPPPPFQPCCCLLGYTVFWWDERDHQYFRVSPDYLSKELFKFPKIVIQKLDTGMYILSWFFSVNYSKSKFKKKFIFYFFIYAYICIFKKTNKL